MFEVQTATKHYTAYKESLAVTKIIRCIQNYVTFILFIQKINRYKFSETVPRDTTVEGMEGREETCIGLEYEGTEEQGKLDLFHYAQHFNGLE